MGLADIDKYLEAPAPPKTPKPAKAADFDLLSAKPGKFPPTAGGSGAIGAQEGLQIPFKEQVPGALATIAAMAVPGAKPAAGLAASIASGPVGRVVAAEVGSMVGRGVTGQSPMPTGEGAIPQILGEVLMAPVAFAVRAAAAREARATYAAKKEFDQVMHKTLDTLEQQGHKKEVEAIKAKYEETVRAGEAKAKQELQQSKAQYATDKAAQKAKYEADKLAAETKYKGDVSAQEAKHAQAVSQHAESAADQLVTSAKGMIPAWKDLPKGTDGIKEMVLGNGQQKLAAGFDAAMKEVVQSGKGTQITLPLKDAEALGFSPKELQAKGWITEIVSGKPVANLDAGEVAGMVTGKGKKDPGLYRRVVEALDKVGVGDPKAREEYKTGQAFISFIDKAKAIERSAGKEILNPEKLLEAMTSVKSINELRNRGQGDISRGPFQAARGGPQPPPEIPKPTVPKPTAPLFVGPKPYEPPPKPTLPEAPNRMAPSPPPEPDIRSTKINPFMTGAAMAELPAMALGHHGFGAPAMIGGLAGEALLPRELVTKAPLSKKAAQTLRLGPSALAELARLAVQPPKKKRDEE